MRLFRISNYLCIGVLALWFQACTSDNEVVVETPAADEIGGSGNRLSDMGNAIVLEWTDLLVATERYATGRPNASARAMAYIYLAAYESVVPGMEGYSSLEKRFRNLEIRGSNQPDTIIWEAALNAAFAATLDHFLLNLSDERKAGIGDSRTSITNQLLAVYDQTMVEESADWGTYVARQVIEFSETDREAERQILEPQPTSYEPPTGDGFWTYSAEPERALYPYWESVRTFVVDEKDVPALDPIAYSEDPDSEYFSQMMEVYEVNNAAKENQGEDLWVAEFWSDDVEGLMMSPPVRQVSIANQLIEQYETGLVESLVMLLKLGFSLNDAAVIAWKYKYEYMVMRPNVYIHEFIDPDYQTNLFRLIFWPNPSFPGYPSGHSCFASAAAGVFIDTFGSATDFTDRSHEGRTEFVGTPRQFFTFEDLAAENGFSRIPLGVHIRMDCEEGLRLGYEISDAANGFDLR